MVIEISNVCKSDPQGNILGKALCYCIMNGPKLKQIPSRRKSLIKGQDFSFVLKKKVIQKSFKKKRIPYIREEKVNWIV